MEEKAAKVGMLPPEISVWLVLKVTNVSRREHTLSSPQIIENLKNLHGYCISRKKDWRWSHGKKDSSFESLKHAKIMGAEICLLSVGRN